MLNLLGLQVGDVIPGDFRVEKPAPIAFDPGRWSVWITEQAKERATAERIEGELGLKPYLPVEHRQVAAGRGRKRYVELAMFSSRLFVPLPAHFRGWHQVMNTRGIRDYMRSAGDSGRPAMIPDIAIEELRRIEAKNDAKYQRKLAGQVESPYRKNRLVWAEILPLRKMLGKIQGADARGRIEILLDVEIFGRKVWPIEPHLLQFADE